MTDAALEVRELLKEDFEFYAEHALKIRTKLGEIKPFVLNRAQKQLLDIIERQRRTTGKVRIIVLKARQMGLSTAIGAWLYWWVSQREAQKAVVVTHLADSTRALFDMTRRFYDNTPSLLKPTTRAISRTELKFAELDSGYSVATAGGSDFGRGETFNVAHLSELAFWAKNSAAANFGGLEQAIPDAPGSAIFIESTANGMSGLFYDLCQGAIKGENGFELVFLPWFMEPAYRAEVPKDFKRTPEEEGLAALYGLDDAQLMFRRRKVALSGIDLFKQEYPSCPEEAFMTTGRPVFTPETVMEMKRNRKPPIARLALEGDKWVPHPGGELRCYHEHDPEGTYYIGADVAFGQRGGDYSVAQVLDGNRRLVATYRTHIHPDEFATVLYHLGMFYNCARIAVESNNHGILTNNRLGKDLAYPNFYTEETYDKITDRTTVKLGFATTSKSKPLILDKLRASVRERLMEIHDEATLDEMLTFVVTETGSMEAEVGNHDDTVMALAICHHINEGNYRPIANEDGWYHEPD